MSLNNNYNLFILYKLKEDAEFFEKNYRELINKKLKFLKSNLNECIYLEIDNFKSILADRGSSSSCCCSEIIIVLTSYKVNHLLYDNQTKKIDLAYLENILKNRNSSNSQSGVYIVEVDTMKSISSSIARTLRNLKRDQHKYSCLFNSKSELEVFIKEMNENLNIKYDLSSGTNQLTTDKFRIVFHEHTNYSLYKLELCFSDETLLNSISSVFLKMLNTHNEHILLDNYLNADNYVYEFKDYICNCSRWSELDFLLKKINLNKFFEKLNDTIQAIEKGINEYGLENICVSFNGGKDCCVVLYLFYAIALRMNQKFPLKVLLVKIEHGFPEMNQFVDHIISSFKESLEFIVFEEDKSKSLKHCLADLKKTRPKITGILMGTRRTDDAYLKNLAVFAKTDGDWPEYMRINPILDWTYSEIWYFIRMLKLPYCSLYDRGYTSIDNSLNTVPNKALINQDGATYKPAYLLENEDAERESRRKYSK